MRENLLSISFFLLLFGCSLHAQETIQLDIDEQYRKGQEMLYNYRYDKAVDYFYECHRAEPANMEFLARLSYALVKQGDYPKAELYLKSILKKDTTDVFAWTNLASIYERKQRYREAFNCYQELIFLDTTNAYYYRQAGLAASQLQEFLAAVSLLQRSHSLNARDQRVIAELGELYLMLKAPDYAAHYAGIGLAADSSNYRLLYIMARAQGKLKDYEAVVGLVEKARELGDTNVVYQRALAHAYLKLEEPEKAIPVLEYVVKKQHNPEYAFYYLSLAYRELKDIDKSREYLVKELKKSIQI